LSKETGIFRFGLEGMHGLIPRPAIPSRWEEHQSLISFAEQQNASALIAPAPKYFPILAKRVFTLIQSLRWSIAIDKSGTLRNP
jgi:hypothetical protein